MISDRARRLVEALHLPIRNEERWEIAQRFLDEERAEAAVMGAADRKHAAESFQAGLSDVSTSAAPVAISCADEEQSSEWAV